MNKETIIKALESHRTGVCHDCPYEHIARCFDVLCADAVSFIKESSADTALKVIGAVKSRGTRNAYSCIISGELHETYTLKGSVLDEIAKESREW